MKIEDGLLDLVVIREFLLEKFQWGDGDRSMYCNVLNCDWEVNKFFKEFDDGKGE